MAADSAKKAVVQRSGSSSAVRGMSSGRSALFLAVSFLVAMLIGASMWVSGSAINQKILFARGFSQILDIVDMSRHIGIADPNFGAAHEDIVVRLSNSEQLKTTGENDGLKTVANPWGGFITVVAAPDNTFRLENHVPPHVCARVIDSLIKNVNAVGLQKIDLKTPNQVWRQIYVRKGQSATGTMDIPDWCYGDGQVDLALTFNLR